MIGKGNRLALALALFLVGALRTEASAAVYVVFVNGLHASAADGQDYVDEFNYFDSAYVVIKASYYSGGNGSMSDGATHNINWHGRHGICNNGGGSYLEDTKHECKAGEPTSPSNSKCVGHNTSSAPYNHDHPPLRHVGYHLAWFLADHYSSAALNVNVVGDSMGGLIVRAAMGFKGTGMFPSASLVQVDNWVSIDSPHMGVGVSYTDEESGDMVHASSFIKSIDDVGWGNDGTRITNVTSGGSTYWYNGNDEMASFPGNVPAKSQSIYAGYQSGALGTNAGWQDGYDKAIVYGGGGHAGHSHSPAWQHSATKVGSHTASTSSMSYKNTAYVCDVSIKRDGVWSYNHNNTAACPMRMAWHAINQGTSY